MPPITGLDYVPSIHVHLLRILLRLSTISIGLSLLGAGGDKILQSEHQPQ